MLNSFLENALEQSKGEKKKKNYKEMSKLCSLKV
jgi:hypothetical protein